MALQKELGDLGVSIGTSLALEALVGNPHSDFKPKLPPTFKHVFINVRTVLRNLIGAITEIGYTDEVVARDAINELVTISKVVSEQTNNASSVVFYYSEYKDINTLLPHAFLKEKLTEKQKQKIYFEEAVFKYMFKYPAWAGVHIVPTLLSGQYNKAYIITHYVVDLLAANTFTELVLVESHTGSIKKSNEFSYKLSKPSGRIIPFNKMTVSVFGDSNILLTAYPPSTKKKLLAIAATYNWHSLTTKDKVKHDLGYMEDVPLAKLLKSML